MECHPQSRAKKVRTDQIMYDNEDDENENLCVACDGFFLLPEHFETLQEIRRRRREIDPSGCVPALGSATI